MYVLDEILITSDLSFSWLFVVIEVPLTIHMLAHCRTRQALKSSSLQWIVYCWLFSAKVLLLYFNVLFDLEEKTFAEEEKEARSKRIRVMMVITPFYYTLLTFRTLRELLRKADSRPATSSGPSQQIHRDRQRSERVTLDIVLLQDMLWHVVIDMIDMMQMMSTMVRPADSQNGIGLSLVDQFPSEVANMSKCAGVFVFLGFLFHQQSFPSFGIAGPGGITPAQASRADASHTGSSLAMQTSSSFAMRGTASTVASNAGAPAQSAEQEDNFDVVKARKRSAMVSILLIDLPFFVIRTYLYSLTLMVDATSQESSGMQGNSTNVPTIEIEATKKAQLDKWWIKNALCLLLQATQLRFVQQAEMEQSQNLQLRDAHQVAAYRRIRRRRRMPQDPHLRRAWEEADIEKNSRGRHVEEAVATASALHPSPTGEKTATDASLLPVAADAESANAVRFNSGDSDDPNSGSSPRSLEVGVLPDDESADPGRKRARIGRYGRLLVNLPCIGGCIRRRRCCAPSSVLLHALMGLAAGWLIAKQDFHHAQELLLHSMGTYQLS